MGPHELHTRRVNENSWRGYVRLGGTLDTALRKGLWPPEQRQLQVRKGRGRATSGIIQIEAEGVPLFFKRFRYRPTSLTLRRLLSRERAMTNWKVASVLWAHGIATAKPEGCLWHRGEAWFLCEAQENAITLATLSRQPPGPDACIEPSLGFALEIARMHEAGVLHRDLKWGNLLVDTHGALSIIDLDSARCYSHPVPANPAARDLARFVVGGLEAGLTESWLDEVAQRYTRARDIPPTPLRNHLKPAIRRISRIHQRRYGRPGVSMATKIGTDTEK